MNHISTVAKLKVIAVTLLGGVITASMTACSRDLPSEPGEIPRGGIAQARPSPAPANDDFDDAVVITALPFTDSVNTSEATTAADDPDDCFGLGPTVWYQFTPSENIRINANTFGSDYDTDLSVYTGTRGNLTQIACNDDTGGLQSSVTFDAVGGQTLFFLVGAFGSGPGGNLVFNVDVAPPPLEVGLTIDGTGSVDPSTGVATIRGTVSCSRQAFVFLDGVLQARLGRLRIQAFFSSSIECDGVTGWEVEVVAQNAFLVAGPVEVTVFASFFDPITGESAFTQDSATVRLIGMGA